MDREYYLRRHSEELAKAASATCEAARVAHNGLAKAFKNAAERLGSHPPVSAGPASFEDHETP